MLKKCISILLVIFLFINSGGIIILFYQTQHAARNQMINCLQTGNYAEDEIVKFKLNEEGLYRNGDGYSWKDTREFEYRGRMYDIIKLSKEDNLVVLYCINDISEERIFSAFNNELNDLANGNLDHSKYRTSLLNLISQAICFNPYTLACHEGQQKFNAGSGLNILHFIEDIPSPPPKTA